VKQQELVTSHYVEAAQVEIRNLHDAQHLHRAHAMAIVHAEDANLDRPTGAVSAAVRHDPFGAEGESMRFDLQAITEPGKQFVALAEAHIEELASRAAVHDEDGSFPTENIAALQASGLLAGCVPQTFDGLGVDSIHDTLITVSRLAQGDGSTAIAANMHLVYVFLTARDWRGAVAAGDTQRADGVAQVLVGVGQRRSLFGICGTEPGTNHLYPRTEATPTDGGWLVNGRKSFATMSEVATHLAVTFKLPSADGPGEWAIAVLPADREGIAVQHNWDALGMRASGSHDVLFTDCFVPEADVARVGPVGVYSELYLTFSVLGTLGLLGAFLGIAEAAHTEVRRLVTARHTPTGKLLAESYAVQHTFAEMEIDLAVMRATLARTAQTADAFFAAHLPGAVPMDELHGLMKDFQCTKWIVNQQAIQVVDKAVQLSGGSGYLSRSVLSRLYRDVRAGPFMQPYSPNEAFQYIGMQSLGLEPRID
jgi:alkylation response protein AidB-like acyl-CoA dehydrogenase